MDTTETAVRPYTELDSRDGMKLSIVLGIILGFCSVTFNMITGVSLDNIVLIVGASTVGTGMFAFGMYGGEMQRRQFDQLFGFVTSVVVAVSTYELLQLF